MSWAEPEGTPVRWTELENWLDRTAAPPAPTALAGITGLAGPMALTGLVGLVVRSDQRRR